MPAVIPVRFSRGDFMTTEQERLEKAKEKLMLMNRKVQNAQILSRKRLAAKPGDSPDTRPPPPKLASNTYIFELTEALLADGFAEDVVVRYVEQVEADSKASDLELDQRELAIQAELKKINRAIARIKDPKPIPPPSPAEPPQKEPAADSPVGYAGLRQARQNPSPVKKLPPITPKKRERKKEEPPEEEPPEVKATGAGAKFLADLMCDADDDPSSFFG
jgi:hypothetical protein